MKAVAAFLQVLCYLTITHAWTCKEVAQHYGAVQIDAGLGKVVMRDSANNAYFLSGSTWYRLGNVQLKHVSVGPAGIWGVDASDRVYKYVAGNFVVSEGISLRQVDSGGHGQVVGVTRLHSVYCLRSASVLAYRKAGVLPWHSLSRNLIYYSCGPLHGCWGMDAADRIFVTQRIDPNTCEASGLVHVEGAAKMGEVGTDGSVFVLNSQGNVYQRTGISNAAPQGTAWIHIPICMSVKHLTYDLGKLWVITTGGTIMQCTQ